MRKSFSLVRQLGYVQVYKRQLSFVSGQNSNIMSTIKKNKYLNGYNVGNAAPIIIVEGNIGVGKTTLTYELGKKLNCRIFDEPVSGNPYLSKFYKEPRKYGLTMQLWLLKQRCMVYMRAVEHCIESGEGVILDRSLFSDHVFATVLHNDQFISDKGYEHYCHLHERIFNLVPFPHIVVYLNITAEECKNRINKRGREYERGISIEYLSKLDVQYEKALEKLKHHGCEILCYDWSNYGLCSKVDKDIRKIQCQKVDLGLEEFQFIRSNIENMFQNPNSDTIEMNDKC